MKADLIAFVEGGVQAFRIQRAGWSFCETEAFYGTIAHKYSLPSGVVVMEPLGQTGDVWYKNRTTSSQDTEKEDRTQSKSQ